MKKRILLAFGMALSLTALTSCGNGIFDNPDYAANQKGMLSVRNVNVAYRTVRPDVSTSQITDLVLKGTRTGESEVTLANAESITALSEKQIELQTGTWSFVLTANVAEIPFHSETTTAQIKANQTNSVSLVLIADEAYGGISITVSFTDTNVKKVIATLKSADKSTSCGEPEEFTTFVATEKADGTTEKSVTFERSITGEDKLADGTYSLDFDFYSEGTTDPINTISYFVRVASGFTTTRSQLIDINETYTITYKYNNETITSFDDDELKETGLAVAGQGSLPSKYSRKTDSFTLDELSKTDWSFKGWYDNEGNKITEIAKGSTGDLTLNAEFEKVTTNAKPAISFDVSPASDIEVTLPDLENLTSTTLTFTADEGYDTYTWKIDGETVQDTGSRILEKDASSWVTGIYDISLTAVKEDGSKDSFYATLNWTKLSVINFLNIDGTVSANPQIVFEGSLITEPTEEEKVPAVGWFKASSDGTPVSYDRYDFTKSPEESMYLVAIDEIKMKCDYTGFRAVIYNLALGNVSESTTQIAKHFKQSETAPSQDTSVQYLDRFGTSGNGALIPAWYDATDETIYYYNGTGTKPYFEEYTEKSGGSYNSMQPRRLFESLTSLETIDVSGFDFSKSDTMYSMFNGCSKVKTITFGDDLDTSNVTYMAYMFDGCNALTSIDLSKFNTAKVTSMSHMFRMCSSLTAINLPSTFDTSSVTDMTYMFSLCSTITTLDLTTFNTEKVTSMSYMFDRCSSLTTIYATSAFVVNQVEEGNDTDMFADCSNLKGGTNTQYSSSHTDKEYARISVSADENAGIAAVYGYFTAK